MLLEGAIGGTVFVIVAPAPSRFVSDGAGRACLAILLMAAAGAYFGSVSPVARVRRAWTLAGRAQVYVFGWMALRGMSHSPRWLPAAGPTGSA